MKKRVVHQRKNKRFLIFLLVLAAALGALAIGGLLIVGNRTSSFQTAGSLWKIVIFGSGAASFIILLAAVPVAHGRRVNDHTAETAAKHDIFECDDEDITLGVATNRAAFHIECDITFIHTNERIL